MTNPTQPERHSSRHGVMEDGARTVASSNVLDGATLASAMPASPPVAVDPQLNSAALTALGRRYDILSEAGHGSMGNVYKARDRETNEIVALKLIKPEFAADQAMMERFKNELLFARKITHKNVCRVYDFNRIGGVAYTSMEFVEGESLRSVLNRFGGLAASKSVDLMLQVCSGLKEAHAQGIVHRDLKPENVMIDSRGNVKIMDFGIARSMEAATRLTGAMVGTPAYMAPEQVAGKPVDYRTDVYALGLIVYELFTGKAVFVADNPVAVALKHLRESPVPPHEIDPTIPVSIERTILKCLEKDPANRYQSIAELENALGSSGTRPPMSSLASTAGGSAKQTVPKPNGVTATQHSRIPRIDTDPKRSSPLMWVILAAFVIAAVMGGIRWAAATRTAKQLPAPPELPAPLPPGFALEKPIVSRPSDAASLNAEPVAPKPRRAVSPNETLAPREASASKANTSQPKASGHGQTAQIAPTQAVQPNSRQPLENAEGQNGNPNAKGTGYVWIGRFMRQDRAQEAAKKIEDMSLSVITVPRHTASGEFFIVLSGPFPMNKIANVMDQLRQRGFTNIRSIRNPVANQSSNP